MDSFITLTTLKNEFIVCNVSKILYFGQVKSGTVVYIDEFTQYTVKETISEISTLLAEKILK